VRSVKELNPTFVAPGDVKAFPRLSGFERTLID
jgi:hypothetical protein